MTTQICLYVEDIMTTIFATEINFDKIIKEFK